MPRLLSALTVSLCCACGPSGQASRSAAPSLHRIDVLATGQSPTSVAADSTTVVWTDEGSDPGACRDGTLMATPLDGGAARVLASQRRCPVAVATDGVYAYWVDGGPIGTEAGYGSLSRVPLVGGPSVVLVDEQVHPNGLQLDGGFVYFTTEGNGGGGTLVRVPLAGGTATTLWSGPEEPNGFVVDGQFVYVAARSRAPWRGHGLLLRVPTEGGPAVTLWRTRGNPQSQPITKDSIDGGWISGVAMDAGSVYWSEEAGKHSEVLAMPRDGGSMRLVATDAFHATHFGRDDRRIYWTTNWGDVRGWTPAGGVEEFLASTQGMARGLCVTPGALLVAARSPGRILRIDTR